MLDLSRVHYGARHVCQFTYALECGLKPLLSLDYMFASPKNMDSLAYIYFYYCTDVYGRPLQLCPVHSDFLASPRKCRRNWQKDFLPEDRNHCMAREAVRKPSPGYRQTNALVRCSMLTPLPANSLHSGTR